MLLLSPLLSLLLPHNRSSPPNREPHLHSHLPLITAAPSAIPHLATGRPPPRACQPSSSLPSTTPSACPLAPPTISNRHLHHCHSPPSTLGPPSTTIPTSGRNPPPSIKLRSRLPPSLVLPKPAAYNRLHSPIAAGQPPQPSSSPLPMPSLTSFPLPIGNTPNCHHLLGRPPPSPSSPDGTPNSLHGSRCRPHTPPRPQTATTTITSAHPYQPYNPSRPPSPLARHHRLHPHLLLKHSPMPSPPSPSTAGLVLLLGRRISLQLEHCWPHPTHRQPSPHLVATIPLEARAPRPPLVGTPTDGTSPQSAVTHSSCDDLNFIPVKCHFEYGIGFG